jgi:hypothetical protein
MMDRVMAQGRIDDLIRAADHERLARRVRRARPGRERAAAVRRIAGAVATAVMWPVRH